jgi:hypothetical protein
MSSLVAMVISLDTLLAMSNFSVDASFFAESSSSSVSSIPNPKSIPKSSCSSPLGAIKVGVFAGVV